jgi:N-acetylglutamate synthase-like GNAT family acetyltransferase
MKKNDTKIYQMDENIKLEEKLLKSINNLMKVLSPDLEKIGKKRLKELIANPLFELYLMEITGEIVGMASLHYMETLAKKSAWVEDVVIHPKHQRKGLGKKIIRHVVERAKKKGIKHVDLTSSPHRVVANHLYRKLKFKPRETNVYRLKLKK